MFSVIPYVTDITSIFTVVVNHQASVRRITCSVCDKFITFSTLTPLVGQQEGHPACKKLSGGMLAWLPVCGKVQICIWPS